MLESNSTLCVRASNPFVDGPLLAVLCHDQNGGFTARPLHPVRLPAFIGVFERLQPVQAVFMLADHRQQLPHSAAILSLALLVVAHHAENQFHGLSQVLQPFVYGHQCSS
jgi:hypothetical protein